MKKNLLKLVTGAILLASCASGRGYNNSSINDYNNSSINDYIKYHYEPAGIIALETARNFLRVRDLAVADILVTPEEKEAITAAIDRAIPKQEEFLEKIAYTQSILPPGDPRFSRIIEVAKDIRLKRDIFRAIRRKISQEDISDYEFLYKLDMSELSQ